MTLITNPILKSHWADFQIFHRLISTEIHVTDPFRWGFPIFRKLRLCIRKDCPLVDRVMP